jgi:AcrR family transcriptional regulator
MPRQFSQRPVAGENVPEPAPSRADGASRRVLPAEERRAQILAAAMDVFAAKGFAEARIDDIAAASGIGKGTVYLHFKDKQDLFEQLVRQAALPVLDAAGSLAVEPNVPTAEVLERLFTLVRTHVLETKRREILRLIIAEGPRFPDLARFYHQEVVSRGLRLMGEIAARGAARGEVDPAVAAHPHLLVAPVVLSLVWNGLFESFDPLPLAELFRAHVQVIAGKRSASAAAPGDPS